MNEKMVPSSREFQTLTALQENEKRTDPAAVVELSAAASDDWIEENQLPDSEVLIFPAFLTKSHTQRKEREYCDCVCMFMWRRIKIAAALRDRGYITGWDLIHNRARITETCGNIPTYVSHPGKSVGKVRKMRALQFAIIQRRALF